MAIQKVCIVGMGSLGILYGQRFRAVLGDEGFAFIADPERIRRYSAEQFTCNGAPCHFRYIAPDDTAFGTPDLIVFAVKATALEAAMDEAALFVGPNTVLLSVLNGISSEEILAERFGREHLLYCVAQGMDATKLGNALTFGHEGQICIGFPADDGNKLAMLGAVCDLFRRAGVAHTVESDIRRRLWSKFMLNVGVNQVVMVTEGTYGTVQQPGPARQRMIAAMEEVITLANAAGVHLTRADLDGYVALIDTLSPAGMPSMRQDGLAHRPTEVALFSGTVLHLAKQYGVAVPVNEGLYEQVKKMENAYLNTCQKH